MTIGQMTLGFGIQFKMKDDFDIDSMEVEIQCPLCSFYNPIWIKQARLRDTIICRGCKANIMLDDNMNTVRKARNIALKEIRKFISELNRFNKF